MYLQEATIYYNKNKFSDCLSSILKSIENDSANHNAYILKAKVKINLGDFNGALEDCNKAKFLNKNDYNIYTTKAIAYDSLNDRSNAISSYKYAIDNGDNNSDTYYKLGYLYLLNGNVIEACKNLSNAGELGNMEAFELIKTNCNFSIEDVSEKEVKYFPKKYSISFPKDWQIDFSENSDKSIHSLVGSSGQCILRVIDMSVKSIFPEFNSTLITDLNEEDLLSEYFAKYKDFDIIESKITSLYGITAYKFRFTFSFYSNKYDKTLTAYEEQYYAINPKTKNILIIASNKEDEKSYKECSYLFDEIIKTIKIL